jgi:hypothetical protein
VGRIGEDGKKKKIIILKEANKWAPQIFTKNPRS